MLVTIREDQFQVSAVEFRAGSFIHWNLKLHTFYHIIPGLSEWRKSSQGNIELDLHKGIKIVWRNIHHEATKVLPNQYLWYDILYKYNDDFQGDFEKSIFVKAETRMEEEEEKHNEVQNKLAADRDRGRELKKIIAERYGKMRARSRVGPKCKSRQRTPAARRPFERTCWTGETSTSWTLSN